MDSRNAFTVVECIAALAVLVCITSTAMLSLYPDTSRLEDAQTTAGWISSRIEHGAMLKADFDLYVPSGSRVPYVRMEWLRAIGRSERIEFADTWFMANTAPPFRYRHLHGTVSPGGSIYVYDSRDGREKPAAKIVISPHGSVTVEAF